jgi:hypothetical protein
MTIQRHDNSFAISLPRHLLRTRGCVKHVAWFHANAIQGTWPLCKPSRRVRAGRQHETTHCNLPAKRAKQVQLWRRITLGPPSFTCRSYKRTTFASLVTIFPVPPDRPLRNYPTDCKANHPVRLWVVRHASGSDLPFLMWSISTPSVKSYSVQIRRRSLVLQFSLCGMAGVHLPVLSALSVSTE